MNGRTDGSEVFRLVFAGRKGARAPPCGDLVNCFLRKRRGAWVGGLLARRALPCARGTLRLQAGLPPPQLPAAPGKEPGLGKSSTISPRTTESQQGREWELFWQRRMAQGRSGPLGAPNPRVRTTQSIFKLHSVAILSQGQKGAQGHSQC